MSHDARFSAAAKETQPNKLIQELRMKREYMCKYNYHVKMSINIVLINRNLFLKTLRRLILQQVQGRIFVTNRISLQNRGNSPQVSVTRVETHMTEGFITYYSLLLDLLPTHTQQNQLYLIISHSQQDFPFHSTSITLYTFSNRKQLVTAEGLGRMILCRY